MFPPWGVGVTGHGQAASLLGDEGYRVSYTDEPLHRVVDRVGEDSMLLLALGKLEHEPPSKRAQTAVDAYVRGGGGLLVVGEHDDVFDTQATRNPILDDYGIAFEDDDVRSPDSENGTESWILVDAPAWNVTDAVLPKAAPLTVEDPARPLVELSEQADPANATVAATASPGEGRVLAISDTEWLWNGDPDAMGVERRGTPNLLAAAAANLTGVDPADSLADPHRSLVTGDEALIHVDHDPQATLEATSPDATITRLADEDSIARWRVTPDGEATVAIEATSLARSSCSTETLLSPRCWISPSSWSSASAVTESSMGRSGSGRWSW